MKKILTYGKNRDINNTYRIRNTKYERREKVKIIKWLDAHLEETVMIITACLIGIIIMFQIIMRYFFKHALPWPEEFCRFCYIYFVFVSVGYSIRNHSMLNVTILQDALPRKVRMLIDIMIQAVMVVMFALFTFYSKDVLLATVASGQKSTALQIPMTVPYMATIIGFALATIRSIQSTIHSIRLFISGGDIKVTALESIEEELSDDVKKQMGMEEK